MLDPIGTGSVADVVARLGAVPAWPDVAAELAIGARRTAGELGAATRALAAGEVVKVFAFRGATHLMTPPDAGAYLALRASSRMWEVQSWQDFYGLAPSDWPPFREYVRQALADGPLTRSELVAALGRSNRYRHLGTIIAGGNETLLKPLTWQGEIGLGPVRGTVRGGEPTFLRLEDVPGWAGIPGLDEAGPTVVAAYLRTYGPTTRERVHDWFGKGLGAKRRAVASWLDQLRERCEHVTIEDDHCLVLKEDYDDLRSTSASTAVRLLPGRDPWVMAPGTSDAHVVPSHLRDAVSRSANLVVVRGVVSGTWTQRRGGPRGRMASNIRPTASHRPRPRGREPGTVPRPTARPVSQRHVSQITVRSSAHIFCCHAGSRWMYASTSARARSRRCSVGEGH